MEKDQLKRWGVTENPGVCSKCGTKFKGTAYFCLACTNVATEIVDAVETIAGYDTAVIVFRDYCTEKITLE